MARVPQWRGGRPAPGAWRPPADAHMGGVQQAAGWAQMVAWCGAPSCVRFAPWNRTLPASICMWIWLGCMNFPTPACTRRAQLHTCRHADGARTDWAPQVWLATPLMSFHPCLASCTMRVLTSSPPASCPTSPPITPHPKTQLPGRHRPVPLPGPGARCHHHRRAAGHGGVQAVRMGQGGSGQGMSAPMAWHGMAGHCGCHQVLPARVPWPWHGMA